LITRNGPPTVSRRPLRWDEKASSQVGSSKLPSRDALKGARKELAMKKNNKAEIEREG
jgi:hypothetical protein